MYTETYRGYTGGYRRHVGFRFSAFPALRWFPTWGAAKSRALFEVFFGGTSTEFGCSYSVDA